MIYTISDMFANSNDFPMFRHMKIDKKKDPQMVPGFFDTSPSNGGVTTLGDYTDGPSDWLF